MGADGHARAGGAQDTEGDENWHIHAIDLESRNVRDLTPWQGVRCHYMIMSVKHPGEMLALLNVRDRKLMDVWRINLSSGAATLEIENPGDVAWWIADDELVVRAGCGFTPQGGFEVRVRSDASSPWGTLVKTSPDEEAMPLGFSKDGRELFLKSSVASDTMRVITIGLASSGPPAADGRLRRRRGDDSSGAPRDRGGCVRARAHPLAGS